MNHSFHIADLIVGGMLMVSSAFALTFTWNRRELVSGISYKQFVRSWPSELSEARSLQFGGLSLGRERDSEGVLHRL
jgi:hypothetical protein